MKACLNCGGDIPRQRKRTSKYCSASCRAKYRAAYFSAGGRDFPPGPHLYALEAAGHVFIGHTRALRSRVRIALSALPPGSRFIGALPGDADRLDSIKNTFSAQRVDGSWFTCSADLLNMFKDRTAA